MFLGERWANQQRVIPGEFCDRFGAFLQPTIVGKPTIQNAGIGTEAYFQRVVRRCSARRVCEYRVVLLNVNFLALRLRSSDESIVQGFAPAFFEIRPDIL